MKDIRIMDINEIKGFADKIINKTSIFIFFI